MMRLFFCFLIFFSVPAVAQTSVGVLDVDYILQESSSAKALQEKRNAVRETMLKELSDKENVLREDGKALLESRQDVAEEEFVKRSKDYEGKLLDMRRMTQKNKRAFEEASAKAMAKLRDNMTTIVADISQERGYDLIIAKRHVVIGENSIDITQDVLSKMNESPITIDFQVE